MVRNSASVSKKYNALKAHSVTRAALQKGGQFMASRAQAYLADNRFYGRIALALAILTLFAFIQFSARGLTDVRQMPSSTHLHAALMTAWLVLYIVQGTLAATGKLSIHRKLGWAGAALAALVVATGFNTGITTLSVGRVPPFFDQPYFLALTFCQSITFGLLVSAAIVNRKRTDWHRRLMLVTMIVLLEPAFGRLLPLPLMGTWFVWVQLALQLAVLAIAMRHDRKVLGAVHPALWWGLGVLVANFVAIQLLHRFEPFRDFALGLVPAAS